MILIIAGMIALTIAAAFWLAAQFATEQAHFQATPDRPCAFGCSMAWLAIRSGDTDAILKALRVERPAPCNWSSGIGTVYDNHLGEFHVFVSPPVDKWTFVVGLPLPHPVGRGFVDKCTPLLVDLGGQFPEVQYFFTYPLIDFFAWACVRDGRLVRAFAATDEGVAWSKGRTTKDERTLGLKLFELRGVRGRKGDAGGEMILHPTEEHVMRLAQRWSLDPTTLSSLASQQPASGFIAQAPVVWRTERIRKADRSRKIA